MKYCHVGWKGFVIIVALCTMLGCQGFSSGKSTTVVKPQGTAQGQLAATPASVSFASVQVGSVQSQSVTLTNSGGATVTISQVTVSGTGFSLSGMNLPLTVLAGQGTSFNVVFTPAAVGSVSGNVAITSDASNPRLSLALSGSGIASGALTANPSSVAFGSVQVSASQQQPVSLTNSGSTSVTISRAAVTGPGFGLGGMSLPLTLAGGQSTTATISFTPQASGDVTGTATITSNATNSLLTLSLSGTGIAPGALTPNPSSLSFGTVQVGNNLSKFETLTNSGGSTVTISQASVTGAGFSVSGLSLPFTLTPSQSVTFSAVFAPQSAGSIEGNIAVTSNAPNPLLNVPLTGVGTVAGQLGVNPGSVNFGNVMVGNSANQPATLSASGASVIVTSFSLSNSAFSVSGLSLPVTIAAGQSVPYTVTFSPQASGAASATVSFVSNAGNSPVQSLTGTGTAPPPHRVSLSWTASTSVVIGYNVYRGTLSGGPYSQINPSLVGSTTYTDNSVLGGKTYYYVTTAVDSNNQQSAYSNQVQAVIP